MPRSHWENTSAMVKYTNVLPMLPVASRYFGQKHKWSHYKLDFLGFGEGPANHGHECSAMASANNRRRSAKVLRNFPEHETPSGKHPRRYGDASASSCEPSPRHPRGIGEWLLGVYICHFGAQHHSLSGL